MTLTEIKNAVQRGETVCWSNTGYEVLYIFKNDSYVIKHHSGNMIGLTWQNGKTMNGEESDFYIRH